MTARAVAISLALVAGLGLSELSAQPRLTLHPNEDVPRELTLENDDLFVRVQLGRYLYLTSFLDKVSGVQFVDPEKPAPLVKVSNQWHLLQVGFNIWQVTERVDGAERGAEIRLFSNSLENPYHLVVRLGMSEAPELRLHLSLEHWADEEPARHAVREPADGDGGPVLLRHLRPPGALGPLRDLQEGSHPLPQRHRGRRDVLPPPDRRPRLPAGRVLPGGRRWGAVDQGASDLEWSFDSPRTLCRSCGPLLSIPGTPSDLRGGPPSFPRRLAHRLLLVEGSASGRARPEPLRAPGTRGVPEEGDRALHDGLRSRLLRPPAQPVSAERVSGARRA